MSLVSKRVVIRTNVTIAVVAALLSIMYLVSHMTMVQALRTNIETTMSRMYTDNPANDTLQITSYPRISQDSNGAEHFVGEVVNKGNVFADSVSIIATFYDSQNGVIGTKDAYTDPATIHPGQAAPFELIVGFGDTIPVAYIDHVKFHLDWTPSLG